MAWKHDRFCNATWTQHDVCCFSSDVMTGNMPAEVMIVDAGKPKRLINELNAFWELYFFKKVNPLV